MTTQGKDPEQVFYVTATRRDPEGKVVEVVVETAATLAEAEGIADRFRSTYPGAEVVIS